MPNHPPLPLSDPDMQAEYAQFIQLYPIYTDTQALDDLRQRQYSRLDRGGHVYLDYTGGGLYAASQVLSHQEFLL